MPRAEPDEVAALSAERDIAADEIGNIGRLADLFFLVVTQTASTAIATPR